MVAAFLLCPKKAGGLGLCFRAAASVPAEALYQVKGSRESASGNISVLARRMLLLIFIV